MTISGRVEARFTVSGSWGSTLCWDCWWHWTPAWCAGLFYRLRHEQLWAGWDGVTTEKKWINGTRYFRWSWDYMSIQQWLHHRERFLPPLDVYSLNRARTYCRLGHWQNGTEHCIKVSLVVSLSCRAATANEGFNFIQYVTQGMTPFGNTKWVLAHTVQF